MGFFSFLVPEQQEDELEQLRKEQRDIKLFKPREKSAEEVMSESTPGAMEEYKTYPQRRGETSSQVFQTADKIIDKIAKAMPFNGTTEAAEIKRTIRANPDNAAKTIEKFYETAKRVGGTDFSGKPLLGELYDQDFTALEKSVRNLRMMKRGAQERELSGKLQQTDLNKNLSELQNLKGQLDTLTREIATAKDTMPEAVSQRGEAENQKALAAKQQQAAALAEHVRQLEAMTAPMPSEQPESNQQPAPGVAPTLPTSATPIQDYLRGFGLEKKDLIPRVHAALTVSGISPEKWDDDVDPRSGVLRIMAQLDKDGVLAGAIARQLQEARQQDANSQQQAATQQQPEDPRIAQTEARIGQREAELRALYASLRDNDFMRTWPGIILYVLVGLITQNPAFAARLIGGRDNRAAIGAEIKGIQGELARLDRQLARDIDRDVMSKREAARRLQHKEDEADRRKWEVSKLMLQHNLIIQRNAKKGNPETFMMKKLAAEFQRALGMASKYSGEMQNEFADPKVRAAARQNFNTYMQRAAELDADIRNMGGAVLEEEPEE